MWVEGWPNLGVEMWVVRFDPGFLDHVFGTGRYFTPPACTEISILCANFPQLSVSIPFHPPAGRQP